MSYVIKRLDQGGGYVSRPGSVHSYTKRLRDALRFNSREDAEACRCVENERVLSIEEASYEQTGAGGV